MVEDKGPRWREEGHGLVDRERKAWKEKRGPWMAQKGPWMEQKDPAMIRSIQDRERGPGI